MANATLTIGGVVGLALAVPIVGSLLPPKSQVAGSWSPLSPQELDALQKATQKPVKLTFTLKYSDAYLPEQSVPEYCWGIRVDNNAEIHGSAARYLQRAGRQGRRSLRRRQHGLRHFQPDLPASGLLLQLERCAKQIHVSRATARNTRSTARTSPGRRRAASTRCRCASKAAPRRSCGSSINRTRRRVSSSRTKRKARKL